MLDCRRSAGAEAIAGGVNKMQPSAKLANSIDQAKKLEQTYVPVNVQMVREADAARMKERRKLRENKGG